MVSPRLRLVLAQLGPKPGRRAALRRCLEDTDLPGGAWLRTDQHTWRTGLSNAPDRWTREAKAAGSVTAWRSFALGEIRWLWIQVVPLARAADGAEAVATAANPTNELHALGSRVTVTESADVAPPDIVGASVVSAREQRTVGRKGEGIVLTIRFATGSYLVVMMASALAAQAWKWSELAAIANLQVARLAA
jgi:hypothetical protein